MTATSLRLLAVANSSTQLDTSRVRRSQLGYVNACAADARHAILSNSDASQRKPGREDCYCLRATNCWLRRHAALNVVVDVCRVARAPVNVLELGCPAHPSHARCASAPARKPCTGFRARWAVQDFLHPPASHRSPAATASCSRCGTAILERTAIRHSSMRRRMIGTTPNSRSRRSGACKRPLAVRDLDRLPRL